MALSGDGTPRPEGLQLLTFLFSDIEGSTRLLQDLGDDFDVALAAHHELIRRVVAERGGTVRRTEGDSFFATFSSPSAAVAAAVETQRALTDLNRTARHPVRIRMGVHTGEARIAADELVGLDVHRAARIMSAGWGGQILVSAATASLLGTLPDGVELRDLGRHHLKDLPEAEGIHQVVAPGLRSEFPALRTLDTVPTNLPTPLTTFVGRQREVTEVLALLRRSRVLTLTGPGGTGKTRLSLAVAAASVVDYPDGVFFVPLAAITDPALVMSAVAGSLGLVPGPDRTPLDLVGAHLAPRRVLVVLDNFEQVLPAAGEVSRLVAAGPEITVLVSSRAALRISGEQEYTVAPLPVPAADGDLTEVMDSDAVKLFAQRVAAVAPGFRLDASNAAAVAEITRRVEGLPLAIELAAARAKLLPLTTIAERLTQTLDLAGGARDLPDRQRTLRGAIAWSHDLLDERARRLFARLSIFRGGADLEHLEAVCGPGLGGDALDVLAGLVDHSLVRRVDAATGVRFAMLETIREYAEEQLTASRDGEEIRDRHAAVQLALAEDAAPHLTGDDSLAWLDRLEADHDNLRAALRHALEGGDAPTALRLVAALWRMWHMRGHLIEGRRNADAALAAPGADRHPALLARAYEAAGGLAYWQGDRSGSRGPYERALELFRTLDDPDCVARSIYNLAFAYGADGPDAARALLHEALEAFRKLDDELGVAKARWGLMLTGLWTGDFAEMRAQGQRCLPVFRELGQPFDLAWALHLAGIAEHALGDFDAARAMLTEALDMFVAAGDASGMHLVLADFAVLHESTGDLARALRLFGATDRMSEETGSRLLEPQMQNYRRHRRADEELDADTVQALRAEGHRMTVEQAVACAKAVGSR